jgi:hypothetical protein
MKLYQLLLVFLLSIQIPLVYGQEKIKKAIDNDQNIHCYVWDYYALSLGDDYYSFEVGFFNQTNPIKDITIHTVWIYPKNYTLGTYPPGTWSSLQSQPFGTTGRYNRYASAHTLSNSGISGESQNPVSFDLKVEYYFDDNPAKTYTLEGSFISTRRPKKTSPKDDFWSGGSDNTKKEMNNDNTSDFWDGEGSTSEEEKFESNTKPLEGNQFIGEIESKTKTLTIVYWDHGMEDGDRVSLSLNKKNIKSNITLTKNQQEIEIKLHFGMNRVDFKALNEGSSSPNTASFKVYDDEGNLISSKEWNITTGFTATLLIVTL